MKIDKNTKSFIKGGASISIAVILTKIMGVLYKVPLSYILGDEGMGYFNTAYAIYGFLYILCTSGVPKAITLSLTENITSRNKADAYSIVRLGVALFIKIGIIITTLNIICAPALVKLIGSKKSLYTIIAIAPSIIFVSVSGVLRGCMNYYNKLSKIAVSQLLEATLKLVLGLALAYVGARMKLELSFISALCVLGITIGSIVSCLYLYAAFNKMFIGEKTRQNTNEDGLILRKSISKIALPISLGAALLNLSGIIDLGIIINKLVMSGVTESEANAIYGNYTTLAIPMTNLVISVLSPLMLAFLPGLANMHLSGDKDGFSDAVKRMIYINNAIAVPASIIFYLYSFEVLDVLFSVSSAAIGAQLLSSLSLGVILLSIVTVLNTGLEAMGKIRLTVISLLFGTIIKLIGNYILIEKMGIVGAPLSTVISYGVSFLISLVGFYNSGLKVKIARICLLDLLLAALCFCPTYFVLYARGGFGGGLMSVVICISISCVAYYLLLCLRVFNLEDLRKMLNMHKKSAVRLDIQTNLHQEG